MKRPPMTPKGEMTRREFIRETTRGLAGVGAGVAGLSVIPLFQWDPAQASESTSLHLTLEKAPTLRVLRWHGFIKNDEIAWNANTQKWEQATGGKVITDYLSWKDVRTRAAMEAFVGTGHDIVLGWYDDPHLYPDKLVDVTDVATYLGEKFGGWYPVCKVYGKKSGSNQWIALPIGITAICINYRKSWVREAGYETPPTHIDEFLKCCRKLKNNGHPTGFTLGHAVGDATTWTHWWLWSFGGKAVERDGQTIAINSPETVMALEAARELYETMIKGVETWMDPHNNQAFLAGNISLTSNASSIFHAAKTGFPDIYHDLGVINCPVGPVKHPTELSMISQAFIFKHSKVPNAAKHFLAFMFEKDQYSRWVSETWGYITQPLRSYYELPAWKRDPRVTPYRECVKRMLWNGYAGPLGAASAAVMSEYIIVDMFADACTGRKTSREAARYAETRLRKFYR